jgi:hypothetical protein
LSDTASLGTDKKSREAADSLPSMLSVVVSELFTYIHPITCFMPMSPLGINLGRPASQLYFEVLCAINKKVQENLEVCSHSYLCPIVIEL